MRETYPECRVLEPEWKSAEPLAEARGARSIVYEYPDVVSGSGLTDHSAQAWADLKNTGQYDVIVSGFYYAQENPVVLTSSKRTTAWVFPRSSRVFCTVSTAASYSSVKALSAFAPLTNTLASV